MSRMKTSWLLLKQSCVVLMKNKKLFFFPAISFCFALIIFLFFFSGILLQPTGYSYFSKKHWEVLADLHFDEREMPKSKTQEIANNNTKKIVSIPEKNGSENVAQKVETKKLFYPKPIAFFYVTILYFVSMILLTFCNTAFFNEIIHALNGQPVSIKGGLKFALTKWKSIVLWGVLAASVGFILRKIEEQFGFIGRFVVGLIGVAWSVATVFAIPILIRGDNNSNPILVLKASGRLIKQKWGEGLIGYVGIQVFSMGFYLIFSIFCMAIVFLFWMLEFNGLSFIAIGLFWLFTTFIVCYLQGFINNIFQCALYLYATEGVLPLGLDEESIEAVWKVKKKKISKVILDR